MIVEPFRELEIPWQKLPENRYFSGRPPESIADRWRELATLTSSVRRRPLLIFSGSLPRVSGPNRRFVGTQPSITATPGKVTDPWREFRRPPPRANRPLQRVGKHLKRLAGTPASTPRESADPCRELADPLPRQDETTKTLRRPLES